MNVFFYSKNINISLKLVTLLNMLSSVIMSCDIYQLTDCGLQLCQCDVITVTLMDRKASFACTIGHLW